MGAKAKPLPKAPKPRSESGKRPARKAPQAPQGFDVTVGQEAAADKIRKRLADTQDALEALERDGHMSMHEYRDGTVDGEIVLYVDRGEDAIRMMQDLEAAFGMDNQRGVWFQVGARFAVKEGEEKEASGIVDRRRGVDEVSLYYRKMFAAGEHDRKQIFFDAFGTMQHQTIPAMQDKYGRKAETIFVRMHWNPDNEKPRR